MRKLKVKFVLWNTKKRQGTVIVALPCSRCHQNIKNFRFISGEPDTIVNDKYQFNKIGLWRQTDKVEFEWDMELETINLLDIESSQKNYSLSPDQRKFYTKQERFLEQNDKIRKTANLITTNHKSDLAKARAIFKWQISNMKQQGRVLGSPGAMNTLVQMDGNCGSFAWLFVSLCRCLNIPARIIMGGLAIEKQAGFHAWAEVFISSLGWITIDSSIAQSLKDETDWFVERGFPGDPEFYFGGICDRCVIFSEGMNINLKAAGLNVPRGLEVVDFMQPGADIYFVLQGDTRRKKIAGWSGMLYQGDTQLDEDEIRREMKYEPV